VTEGRWACGSLVGQWAADCGPVGGRPGGSAGRQWPTCVFSVLRCGGAFHKLRFQDAKVSALPGALPLPSMSPASQQGP
jgi:hypothetical protein